MLKCSSINITHDCYAVHWIQKPGPSNCKTGEHNEGACPQPVTSNRIWQMEDQLIMARAYLQLTPPSSKSYLVRELKQRIKEIERVLSQVKKDSDLSRRYVFMC